MRNMFTPYYPSLVGYFAIEKCELLVLCMRKLDLLAKTYPILETRKQDQLKLSVIECLKRKFMSNPLDYMIPQRKLSDQQALEESLRHKLRTLVMIILFEQKQERHKKSPCFLIK